MTDFAAARRMMVDGQVRTSDVTDHDIIAAMMELPRERFVPAAQAPIAYLDRDIPVDAGRCLLKPMVLSKLVHAASVRPGSRVLDVACGTGYSSALLARLVGPSGAVAALEDDADRVRRCADTLGALGAGNVTCVCGPLDAGWPALAPYDVILVNGAMDVEPQRLLAQLKEQGRLVGVFGVGPAAKAMIYRHDRGGPSGRSLFDSSAPALAAFARAPVFQF